MEIQKPDWLARMEGILETLNEGVMIVDDCNQIIFANDCLLQMVGYPLENLLGKGPDHFYHGEELVRANQQMFRWQSEGSNRFEFYVPRADGTRVPVIISARSIEDLEGRVYAVITFTDIGEQKRIEQQLREANAQLEQRQREIEFELSLAERVQQSLAPQGLRWNRATVETAYLPVRSIGGDFGMVVPHGDEALTLMVCDVSGHGISSALMANRLYSETVSLLERRTPLDEMLRSLNRFVLEHIRTTGFYFSMAAARLDRQARCLSYAGAGHPPALWVACSGQSRRLMPRSAVVGLMEDGIAGQAVEDIPLDAGDRLVLYTDGITDVFDHRDQMLGTDGLLDVVRASAGQSLPLLRQAILDRVAAWRHGPATDDMSLVLVEVH